MFECNFQSKNKKSADFFTSFLKIYLQKKSFKTKLKTKKVKVITLLKSPHVHKKAQEHFETRSYRKKVLVNEINFKKFVLIFKKLLILSFHDLKLKIAIISNKKCFKKVLLLKLFHFGQKNQTFGNFYYKRQTKTSLFLKLLNFNGASLLKTV